TTLGSMTMSSTAITQGSRLAHRNLTRARVSCNRFAEKRWVSGVAPCFALVIASCALDDGGKQKILEAVRRDSAAYCFEASKEGCEFSVGVMPDGWSVLALPILRSEDGERSYVPGAFQAYSYSKEGQLVRTMPG